VDKVGGHGVGVCQLNCDSFQFGHVYCNNREHEADFASDAKAPDDLIVTLEYLEHP
jgi:hypothetical protein